MLFNSYIFIFLFLPIAIIGYFSLNRISTHQTGLFFLTVMSLLFCGYNSAYALAFLFVNICVNYCLLHMIWKASTNKKKHFWMLMGIFLDIGALFLFKYYNFFMENLNFLLGVNFPLLKLILPLGISFYTFQQLSCLIDSYKGECPTYSFSEYILYVSFFPKLIQGPITYHSELLPQLRHADSLAVNYENICRGIYAFSLGLAKKVLLADTFSKMTNVGYGNISDLNSTSAALVMICYSLQIYFDFSGYCDMAYGIGYMFNIKLPLNFNSPYKSVSISDFWDRWHMTLTRFFTKYIYIPLGGSRRGKAKTYLNVMIVFLISGLWHGANWTFVFWGMLHGLAMVFEKIICPSTLKIPKALRIIITFLLVTFAWSLFRADSLNDACALWRQLFCGGFGQIYPPVTEKFYDLIEMKILSRAGLNNIFSVSPWIAPVLFICASVFSCFTMQNTQEKTEQLVLTSRKLFTVIALMLWSIMSLSEISEFLYFNF